jgi:hypothetical protein
MAISLQQKRALLWGLGILTVLVLASVAWAQICASIAHCFS